MRKIQIVFITIATMIVLYFVTVIPMLGVRMIKIKESYSGGDWMAYPTAEELVNAAEYVYEGKVTGISFDTLSMVTAEHMRYSSAPEEVDFYTIYEIEVTKVYKGDLSSKAVLKVFGGIEGEKEFEQNLVLAKSNMPYRTLIKGKPDIKVGESYIFCTRRSPSEKQQNYTMDQFAFSEKAVDSSARVNYNTVKEYLTSEKFTNPEKVSTTYVDIEKPVSTSAEEIVNSNAKIYEGRVWQINFLVLNSKLYTVYRILVDDTYKGQEARTESIRIEGGIDNYRLDDQYRMLNFAGLDERKIFKDMPTLEVGKTYLFAANDMEKLNPAQFAFCSDNSNAPGGVDYKMMKEYLEK